MLTDDSQRDPVEEIAEQFVERYRRGEQVSIDEYAQRYPKLAERLTRVIPLLILLENGAACADAPNRSTTKGGTWTPPSRLGEFRLLREVGRGGMGIVYEAQQESLGRRVALKLLPFHAVLSPRELERFHREAQAAASLHHSNIVPVFSVGEDQGIHYYAMQFIDGVGIDEALRMVCGNDLTNVTSRQSDDKHPTNPTPLDGSQLSTRVALQALAPTPRIDGNATVPARSNRVDGFEAGLAKASGPNYYREAARIALDVAQALAYAHSQGVLHRDIKPSNILLDDQSKVWVTDFGLAKTDGHDDLTRTGDMAGTLRYMAPERLRGWSDPRSDVYGLGLTLYEMLAHRPAFDGADRAQLIEQITRHDPIRPGRIRGDVPRDLETIVLKAIAKEPAQRYQSASELGEDLHWFLDGRPIRARRVSAAGRAWLWARRNRALAAVGAIAASLLVIVATVTTIGYVQTKAALTREQSAIAGMQREREQAIHERERAEGERARAEQNFRKARQAVDRYLTLVSEEVLLEAPSMKPLRAELLESATQYYEEFAAQASDDPNMKAELVVAYFRLADVASQLGREWFEPFRRGIELADEVFSENADPEVIQSWQPGIYKSRWLGAPHDHADEALRMLRKAKPIWQQLTERYPDVPGFRSDLAGIYTMFCWFEYQNGNTIGSLAAAQKSSEILKQLVEDYPHETRYRFELGILNQTLGEYFVRAKLYSQGEQHLVAAVAAFEALTDERPDRVEYRAAHGRSLALLGSAYRGQKRIPAAVLVYREATRIFEPLVRQYPLVDRFFASYDAARRQQSQLAASDDDGLESLELLNREFVEISRARFGDDSDEVARAMAKLAQFLFESQGKYDESISIARQTLDLRERTFGPRHSTTGEARHKLARMLVQLPGATPDDAIEALRLAEQAATTLPDDWRVFESLGIALYRCGDYEASMQAFDKANRLDDKRPTNCRYYRAMVDWLSGNVSTALQHWKKGEAWVTAHPEQLPYYRLARDEARAILAPRLPGNDDKQIDKTVAMYRAHLAMIRRRFGEDSENTYWIHELLAQTLFVHLGKYDEALSLARATLAMRERTLGDSHASTAEAREKLSRLLSDWPDAKPADYKEALRLAQQAIDATSDDYPAYMAMGKALYRCGRFQESVDAIEKAHKLAGHGLTVCRYYLAMDYWKLGDAKMAREQWDWGENFVKASPHMLPYFRLPREEARTVLAPMFEQP